MAATIFFLIFSFLLIPTTTSTHLQSHEEKGYISVVISSKGIEFAKEVLINKALSSIIPLRLPDIEKTVKIPVVGKVHIALSNVIIDSVDIGPSYVETGEMGIALVVSGASASLSMDWKYSYKPWLVPVEVSDSGGASVQVEDMEVELTVGLEDQGGTLKLSLLDCGCNVKDISVKLDGGASWLYQGVVDAFQGRIEAAVENAISKKIREGVIKLNSQLRSIPKQIRVDDFVALNVTFMSDPLLSSSSIELEIDGRFTAMDDTLYSKHHHKGTQDSVSSSSKMITISLHENVFNSAGLQYYNAGRMQWIIDQIPNQSFLNTAEWRHIIPQLYKQYPDANMNLNLSVTSPPVIHIETHDVDVTIYLDVTINVLYAAKVIPIACISSVISASCTPNISVNNLGGSIELKDLTVYLEWSKIGNLHLHLVESIMYGIVKNVFLPFVNLRLKKGFPLPVIHGFSLNNSEILNSNLKIMINSDVSYMEMYY